MRVDKREDRLNRESPEASQDVGGRLEPRRRPALGATRRSLLAAAPGVAAGIAALALRGVQHPASAESESSESAAQAPRRHSLLQSAWVEVSGLPIHMLVSSDPPSGAPPIVLVHGLALSGRYMVPTAEVLARDYHVYVPDFPGFGDSGKPARVLDVPGLADALAAWMMAVGLERAMLLGNSFGCQIIADLAARHPEQVERAVLQGPTTPPDERTWLWQFIRWQQNSPHNPPEMGRIARRDYAKCGLIRALMTFQFSLNDQIEDKLPRIEAPMLVVRGSIDPICPQDWAEYVAGQLPHGELAIIPGVAHTLVFTAPNKLVETSRQFLERTRLTGG